MTKVDNNINYQFNNVHKSKNTENYISKDILLGYLRKHNWEIINEFTNDKNELTNLYTWYSVTKKLIYNLIIVSCTTLKPIN